MRTSANYPSLKDRVVLITGGASGIGAAFVRAFAQQGARVAFLDVDEARAGELLAKLESEQLPAPFFQLCDVSDIKQLRDGLSTLCSELGDVQVLINNAASDDRHSIDEVEPAYWDERMAVNLRHHFFAIQALRQGMAASGGGAIINMGSIAWRFGMTELPAYATAKAAIMGMTKSLARELGPQGIRVNCIEPGLVMTERQKELWVTPDFLAKAKAAQCLDEMVEPQDVADLALFLASEDSRRITGQSIIVDAGWI